MKTQTIKTPHRKLPMIAVVSLKIGGGGKTSSALAISQELSKLGIKHGILCLDLKQRMSKNEPFREIETNTPYHLGSDEACYLAQNIDPNFCTIYLCKRRDVAWVKLAEKKNLKLLLSDDGWEDPRIVNAVFIRTVSPNEKTKPSKSDLFPQGRYRSLLEQHPPPLLTLDFGEESITYSPSLSIQIAPPKNFMKQTLNDLKKTVLILGIGDSPRVIHSIKEQGLLPKRTIKLKDHSEHFQKQVEKELNKGNLILSSLKDISRLDKNLQKHPSIYGLQYSLKLNYPINKLLERANVKY